MMTVKLIEYEYFAHAHLARRLREIRLKKGLTQAELGKLVDLSPGQISTLEGNKARITAARVAIFAEVLGVSVGAFYKGLSRFN